ncbi:DUF899 domain-containing protein [Mesorhizobium sp. NBSH29]|uniref:DUF899 domain-containing protein n=1 Tax=Mesorhizobium sp. NBSH29 TaxID=2654249 RepID=UPI00189643DF|nr:thioredoxin family protein [Mesorhizobium sp. NBSH29]QPC86920.1 DUF899 domain-containing protein [Mesorhizobium sp. NBSH29]
MNRAEIVSKDRWAAAQKAHLQREKQLTRMRDSVNAERQKLPWRRLEKTYEFLGPQGKTSLADLFDGRSQLIVQHFMFAPEWQEGCVGCSFLADHVDAARRHFEHKDLSFAAVSRAPLAKIENYRRRLGWRFTWVSSEGSDFNFDFHVSFRPEELATGEVYYNYRMTENTSPDLPGVSTFYRNETGEIFHVSSNFGRGDELLIGAYNYLDLAPKGRDETGPSGNLMDWVRRNDQYEKSSKKIAAACCA